MMLLGISIVLGAALFGANYALSAYQVSNHVYLESIIMPTLGIYTWHIGPTLTPFVPMSDILGQDETLLFQPLAVQLAPVVLFTQTVEPNSPTQIAETTPDLQPITTDTAITETQIAPTIPAALTPTHAPVSPSQPVVRLKIPNISVDRAVVDIGLVPGKNGEMQWNSDSLFATSSRQDLVGHLDGSALPGESSNIVMIGHNYDWGIFQWNGVFYNLKKLKPGDKIILFSQDGRRLVYRVERVKEIPFTNQNEEELFKHFKHMGPTKSERLTLVTCGGANLWKWNKRVYVIAYPQSE